MPDWPSEFTNPILRIGMFAVSQGAHWPTDAASGALPGDAAEQVRQDVRDKDGARMLRSLIAESEASAVRAVTESPELLALPDDDLRKVIDEVDAHWRAGARDGGWAPESIVIFPALMRAAAEARVKRLAQVRFPDGSDDKGDHERRRATWIGVLARCLLSYGQSLLLVPATEAAWQTFVQSNLVARALPDFGQLRLPELLAACYGAQLAADMAGQTELRDRARREFNELQRIPGREREADEAARGVSAAFDEIMHSLRARQARPPKAPAPLRPEDFPDDYCLYYMSVLQSHARSVALELWDYDTAFAKLLQRVDPAKLTPGNIDMVAVAQQTLLLRSLQEALALHRMNYDVALLIDGPDVAPCRVKCLLMLGEVHLRRCRTNNNDPAAARDAKVEFERALELSSDADQGDRNNRAHALARLVLCHRALGEFEIAGQRARDAIALLERSEENAGLTLASAHGNLGDALEMQGHLAEGLREHLVAFRMFLRLRDARGMRTALAMISRLAPRLGKADEAVTAYQEAADASIEAADFGGAIDCLLGVAQHAYQLRRFADTFQALQRADVLLRGGQAADAAAPATLRRRHMILSWAGTLGIVGVMANPTDRARFDQALADIESARRIAIDLRDDELLAGSWLQRAMLMLHAGQLEHAEQCCDTVQLLSIPPSIQHRHSSLYAQIRVKQSRFDEAIALFTTAIRRCPDQDSLFEASYLNDIAQCHERLGRTAPAVATYGAAVAIMDAERNKLLEQSRVDFVGHSSFMLERLVILTADPDSEAFDPIRSLHWIERAKSRTFSEMLGRAPITLHSDATPIESLRTEESTLLERAHMMRLTLMSQPTDGSQVLTLQAEHDDLSRRLDDIYRSMATIDPEYVALRRGETIAWQELTALIASPA